MNIIFESTDAMGKDTQIALLERELEKRGKAVHILHYSNIRLDSNSQIETASKIRYREMFNVMKNITDPNVFIFNRAHLGETVYSPLYRNYNGDYVFDYEKEYLNQQHPKTFLIVFTDDVDNVIARDIARNDGKSFTLDKDKKQKEIELFEQAYEKSSLCKKLVKLNNRTPEQIFNEDIKPFIFGE